MPPKKVESRPLNAIEQKLHHACLSAGKALTQKEIDALVPVANERVAAINFLLGVGALKILQDANNHLSYKAISKKELDIKKEMGGDENMVLSHIQAAGNQGIWTKHLKAKTELHQTVITRCLKSLEQKGLIKAVNAVKYPTRKIYMMSHLEPSVELTGGPWYSENELDTEFINTLTQAILKFIQDKSFPKTHKTDNTTAAPLFPISQSSSYPTAKMIHSWLQKSRLSEQDLGVEHVEMLLDVLIYDGQIERLPAYGANMWDMSALDLDSDEERNEKKRKRKRKGSEKNGSNRKNKKRSRRDDDSSDEESEDDTRKKKKQKIKGEGEDEVDKPKKKRMKKKEESDTSDDERWKKKKRSKRRKHDSEEDSSDSESESEGDRRKSKKRRSSKSSRSRSKKRLRSSSSESGSDSDSSSSDSESDSSSMSRRKKKRKSSKSSSKRARSQSKSKAKSSDVDSDEADGLSTGFTNVYRAIREERVSLGLTQAPCCRCPVFAFCSDKGPVNPKACTYYGDWLQQGIAGF